MTTPHPPRLLEALLTAVLPPGAADEILGDLHEEFVALARVKGRHVAGAWYAGQVLRLGAPPAVRRLVRPGTRPAAPPPPSTPGDSLMRTLLVDTRYAIRSLRLRPALTALVVLTLGLGLGANAAIFQVIDALILRPFTFDGVDQVLMVAETAPDADGDTRETVSPANFLDWRRQADVFAHLAAFDWWDVNLAAGDAAERASGFRVTPNFFAVLGVEPAFGRTFTPDEDTPGRDRRAILSHALWTRRFNADPGVLGRTILLDAEPFEVVGVAPPGFDFPLGTDIWAPLAFDAPTAARRDRRHLSVIGRLAPGRSIDEARTQMAAVGGRLAQQHPETNRGRGARAMTLVDGMRDQGLGPIVTLWQASAAFVLLIACANIANLLLARGAERRREIALRTALGASRARIVRELLIESGVLAAASVPAALGLAWVGITLIRTNLPPRLVPYVSGWQTMDVDARLVGFTLALAIVASAVFGMLPALRGSRAVLTDAMKDGARGATAGRARQRARGALVVAQVALALPLLVLAGISTAGAHRFLNGSQGYEPDALLVMRAALPLPRYAEPAARRRFADEAVARLSTLPGIRSAALSNIMPALGSNSGRAIAVDGHPPADPANPPTVDYRAVSPAFLSTMGIPLLQGRGFHEGDRAESMPVAILSRSAARQHFAETDPIGRRVRLGNGPWLTVVGVAGDVIHDWFARRDAPTVYQPYAQAPSASVAFAIRTDGDPGALAESVRAAVRAVDPAQAVYDLMPMRVALEERTIGLQYVAAIMAVFGALALVLALVGVYSLMSFVVTQRRHEIGVRIALGAVRADVLRLTVGQATRLTLIGVTVGLALALVLSEAVGAAMAGVIATDIRMALGFACVLVTAAVAAGYVPARRATAIDPIIALRE